MKRVKKDVVKAAKESVLLADDLLLVVDAAKRWVRTHSRSAATHLLVRVRGT